MTAQVGTFGYNVTRDVARRYVDRMNQFCDGTVGETVMRLEEANGMWRAVNYRFDPEHQRVVCDGIAYIPSDFYAKDLVHYP